MRKGNKRVSTVAGFKAARRQEGKDIIERFEEGALTRTGALRAFASVGYHVVAAEHMLATGRAY